MARTSVTPTKNTRTGAQLVAAEGMSTETADAIADSAVQSVPQSDAIEPAAVQSDSGETAPALTNTVETTVASQQHDAKLSEEAPSGDSGTTDAIAAAAPAPDTGDAKVASSDYASAELANKTIATGTTTAENADDGMAILGGGAAAAEGPTASIGPGNLSDLLEQLVGTNSTWQKEPVNIDGVDVIVLTVAFPELATEVPFHWQVADGMTYTDKNGEEVYSPTGAYSVFSAFGDDQIEGAMRAFAQWEALTNIRFDVVEPDETADIYMYGVNEPDATWGATSNHQKDADGEIVSNRVRVNTEKSGWDNMELGQGGVDLLMHELGHTLGLSHPGSYDTGDGATYDTHAEYIEDSHMYTIMSYFSGENTGANYINVNGDGIPNFTEILDTPRSHDIYTIQQLYGVNWETRDGDTTYGYNASGVEDTFDFDVNGSPVLTIWDGGGNDTLDLSGSSLDAEIDLNPGAFSSTHGQTYNISIAHLASGAPAGHENFIENAIGGSGDDELIGNVLGNVLTGNGGFDYLYGEGGNDSLFGGGGMDQLYGGDAVDTLFGGSNDDLLSGGSGLDFFYGGTGQDTVDFTHSNADYVIDLGATYDNPATGESRGLASIGDFHEFLQDIENVETGDGDDTITGTDGDNEINAGDGENVVYGLDGDDTLYGGIDADRLYGGDDEDVVYGDGGNDRLYGGNDIDTLIGASGNDRLYGGNDDDELLGGDGVDRLYGGQGVDTLEGHRDGDYLYGGHDGDDLYGGEGADRLYGGDGMDSLFGGDDRDTLYGGGAYDYVSGGSGNDTLSGGEGDDFLNGGSGQDIADFTYSDDDWTVVLGLDSATSDAGEADDLWSIEGVRMGGGDDDVYGDGGDNTMEGNGGNDILFGGGGDDGLYGGAGNDRLTGGAGTDYLIGGTGMDTASYATSSSAVAVDLEIAGLQNTVGAGMDGLSQIENIEGSDYSDWLYGDDLGNRLYGGDGTDVLGGRGGIDWLFGGDGDDFLLGGEDGDLYYGGAGSDTVSYHDAGGSVWVDLNLSGFQNTAAEGLELLSSIENLNGSAFGDILTGDSNHNQLDGNGGNDALIGGNGDDGLYGGSGNDQLYGGLGNDYLNGGSGSDWANYSSSGLTSGVSVSLNLTSQFTGGAGVDTLYNIENLHGTNHSDSLFGDENANHLIGDGGADWLFGGDGNDELESGSGNDLLAGGNGHDDIVGGGGNDSLFGGAGFDDFVFHGNWGHDTVGDFNVDQDELDFSSVAGLNTIAQLTLTDTASGVNIAFGDDSVTLTGVSSWQLADDNFFV